ncbi:MAG: hypothetical protein ACK4ZA_08035, partial [Tsuneonella troitsensis]
MNKLVLLAPIVASVFVTACGPASRSPVASTPAPTRVASVPPTRPTAPPATGFRTARVMTMPG